MNILQDADINCPTCGETITILLDGSVPEQQYIEDCQVCCRPIVILVEITPTGDYRVQARHENDT